MQNTNLEKSLDDNVVVTIRCLASVPEELNTFLKELEKEETSSK
jgi:plastocyanin domain-containing protein